MPVRYNTSNHLHSGIWEDCEWFAKDIGECPDDELVVFSFVQAGHAHGCGVQKAAGFRILFADRERTAGNTVSARIREARRVSILIEGVG